MRQCHTCIAVMFTQADCRCIESAPLRPAVFPDSAVSDYIRAAPPEMIQALPDPIANLLNSVIYTDRAMMHVTCDAGPGRHPIASKLERNIRKRNDRRRLSVSSSIPSPRMESGVHITIRSYSLAASRPAPDAQLTLERIESVKRFTANYFSKQQTTVVPFQYKRQRRAQDNGTSTP